MATPLDFARALLNRLGLPQTRNRLVSLVAFAAQEGGHWGNPASRFNPFNTCRSVPGSRQWGGPGCIQAFPDWGHGIEATALTIGQGNMRAILEALKQDADPKTFQHAVTSTPWCPQSEPSCADYAARDPYTLYNSYAGRSDSTSLDEGIAAINWKLVGGVVAIASLAGGAVYWIGTDGGRRRFRF